MKNRISGTCFISVDGDQLELAGKLTCSLDLSEKEGLSGLSGVAGYKETPRVPFIDIEVFVPKGFPMAKLSEADDMVVTAELANGMTGVLSQAWVAGAKELDAAEGKMNLKFEGKDGKWI